MAFLFSSENYPEMELLGLTIVLIFKFWGMSVLFFMVAAPVYIPTSSAQGVPSPHPCQHVFVSFGLQPFWQVWGNISSWSWYSFPWWLAMLASSPPSVGHLYIFFGKYLFKSSAHNSVCCFIFFWCWVIWNLYIFRILTPYQILLLQRSFVVLFCSFFFFCFLPLWFDGYLCVMFRVISFLCACICYRFLPCSYHEGHIKYVYLCVCMFILS